MFRKALIISALVCAMILAQSAQAGMINGDFDDPVSENGWTRWRAPWGAGEVWDDPAGPSAGTLSLPNGSFGWYQRIQVVPSCDYTIEGEWSGDIDGAGWAEVMLFTCTEGQTEEDVVAIIDSGPTSAIAVKKDSWGLNPPTQWGWEPIGLSPHPDGPGLTIHATCAEIVVALKVGDGGGSGSTVSFDNLALTPEPATIALLGLGGLALLRRRR